MYGNQTYGSTELAGYIIRFPKPYFTVDGLVKGVFDSSITTDGIVGVESGQYVIFNGVQMNAIERIVERTTHESAPTRLLSSYQLARRDGEKLVSAYYGRKEITITGYILADTQEEFENQIDYFKGFTSFQSGNLKIFYRGTSRQYVATATEVQINRDSFNIDWAPYSMKFLVPDGKGYDVEPTTINYPHISVGSIRPYAFDNEGTAQAFPVLTIQIHSQIDVIGVRILSGFYDMHIDRTFSNGDIVTVDYNNFTVQVNGVEVQFTGSFIVWPIGTTGFQVGFTTVNPVDIDMFLTYTKAFL